MPTIHAREAGPPPFKALRGSSSSMLNARVRDVLAIKLSDPQGWAGPGVEPVARIHETYQTDAGRCCMGPLTAFTPGLTLCSTESSIGLS